MAQKKGTGKAQRKKSASAQARKPNLAKYYGKQLADVELSGGFDFRVDLVTSFPRKPPVQLNPTAFEWADEEESLTGSVTLQRPDPGRASSLRIALGDQVRCRVRWQARWYTLWTMRVGEDPEVDALTGEVTANLSDELSKLKLGKRHYIYRKTKRRKRGYYGHEALRLGAKKAGVRLGAIVRCTERESKIDVNGSFLDLAKKVYTDEGKRTGKQYVLRMRNGRFEVVNFKRGAVVYVFGQQLRSANPKVSFKKAKLVTVLTGTARLGKGKDAKKIRHTTTKRAMVERFGFSQDTRSYGRVESRAQLVRKMKRDLADEYELKRSASIQVTGIPFVRRGDAVQLALPGDGFRGKDAFVFVKSIRHDVSPGGYTSDLEVVDTDPFQKYLEDQEKKARAAKRKARAKRAAARKKAADKR